MGGFFMENREQTSYEPSLTDQLSQVEQIRLYQSPEWEGVQSPETEGARLMVPRFNIFGIQPAEDYSRVTERKITEACASRSLHQRSGLHSRRHQF